MFTSSYVNIINGTNAEVHWRQNEFIQTHIQD